MRMSHTKWQLSNTKMLMDVADKEIRDTQVQIHTVAYERFKDHPEKEVSKILEFCRLEQDQAVEAYLRDRVVRRKKYLIWSSFLRKK